MRTRIVLLAAGVVCIALGAVLGWFAARQGGDARTSTTAASASAASQAATTSEGWAHVASGAYTLAKLENAAAQAARRQASEYAAKAEKAAAQASAAAVQAAREHKAFDAAVKTARAADAARPAVAVNAPPSVRPQRSAAPKPVARVAAKPVERTIDEGCRRAIIFERTAAGSSISRHAAYNAVMSGFAMNAHCGEPQHSLNEAYLLAQRASAEGALHTGDWESDLRRSDELLAQCVKRPEYDGTASSGCRTRLRKNARIRQSLQHAAR